MIYGIAPINIVDDQTDRVGIRTLLMSQMWQASRWPMTLPELDAEAPPVPDVPGGLWFIGKQTRRNGGALRTTWTFEGVDGDGKSVTFKTRGKSFDYAFQPGFSQASILVHPRIQKLIEDWGGQVLDGEVIFPPTAPSDEGGSGFKKDSSAEKPNPMFGRKDFLRIEGTYSYRYVAQSEAEIPDVEGRIFKSGQLPGTPRRYADRDWLCAGAPYQRRGPVLDVQEIYWLSGPGGWPKEIYSGGAAGK